MATTLFLIWTASAAATVMVGIIIRSTWNKRNQICDLSSTLVDVATPQDQVGVGEGKQAVDFLAQCRRGLSCQGLRLVACNNIDSL